MSSPAADLNGGAPAKVSKTIRKAKTGKRKAGPGAPKRPLSAFIFWGQEERPKLKKENPGLSFAELGRILGQKWSALDDIDKAPFVKMAEADRERYDRELESRPRAPKKAMSAFTLFSNDRRETIKAENPGLIMAGDIAKLLGEEWRQLDDEAKAHYGQRADLDKARYEREWARFSAEYPDLADSE